MNTTALTLASVSLGAMIGITGTHYSQVKDIVKNGQLAPHPAPIERVTPGHRIDTPALTTDPAPVLAAAQPAVPQAPTAQAVPTGIDPKLYNTMLEMMEAMRMEQKNMRDQIAETNRDMHNLTFRVDTHSTEFRPLRAGSSRPRTLEVPETRAVNPRDADGIVPAP